LKITYDPEADALYIRFGEGMAKTEHVADGMAVDYDAAGRIVGVEILDVRERVVDKQALAQVKFELYSDVTKGDS
jgi:YD repeat-containing protein